MAAAALALLLVSVSGVAWAATWKSGKWKGHGDVGNVCIKFTVKGSRVTSLFVEGAPDCGYRYRCTGGLDRSGSALLARNIRIRKDGRFVFARDLVLQPPRPGPGARRMGAKVTGKLNGSKASGTFRSYFSQDGAGGCDSGTLRWKATFRN